MNKQTNSRTATAPAFELDAGRLFTELGFSATFFDSMPTEIVLVGENGRIIAANERFRQEFGDPLGDKWIDLLADEKKEVERQLRISLNRDYHSFRVGYLTNASAAKEYRVDSFRLDGNTRRVAFIHRRENAGRLGFWIPKEAAAEKSLVPKAADYSRYDTFQIAVVVLNKSGNIVYANNAAAQLLYCESKDLVSHPFAELIVDLDQIRETGRSGSFAGDLKLRGALDSPAYTKVTELPGDGDDKVLLLETRDSSAVSEAELYNAHEFYRLFVDQDENEITRFDLHIPVSLDAPAAFQASQILEQALLTSYAVANNETLHIVSKKRETGTTFGDFFSSRGSALEIAKLFVASEYRLLREELMEVSHDESESFFNTNLIGIIEEGKLVRLWLSRRDITLRKQAEKAYLVAEDQLRQSQKIEPIGRLAGGIAHDFNNFLAVIMLQVEMMRGEIDEHSPTRRRIDEIMTVTDKAANMVKQLLAFGRKQTMRPHHLNLNDVIEEFIKMTRSLIGEDIEIELALDAELGACFVDPNQLTQVLMNLAVNAKDAMPDGGVLRISTENLDIDANTFKHRAQHKGNYIQLTVTDTGIGMDQATKKHAFEPFFTTKEAHKGTGLGLATVYGIAKQSKGFIWIDSKVNEGTTFRVQFPRTDGAAKVVKKERASKIPRGTETILLVEDEELIRKTSVEVLRSLGYKIIEAKDGAEAINLASEFEGKIHLLLTDVVMPRMNGRDLAKKVRSSHPELSVMFMSGYADDIITRHGILESDVHFLGKPFSPLTLANRVREALGDSERD